MSEQHTTPLQVVQALWIRETLRFIRARSRIVGSIVTPLMFLIILGPGIGGGSSFVGSMSFTDYIAPGIIATTILFSAMMGGVSIIWDREFGFLREILVAPVSRFYVALGKAVGGVTAAMIQGLIMLVIAWVIGVKYVSIWGVLACIPLMFLMGLGFIGIGIALASVIESHEGFQMVISFIMFPMFFLGQVFFPISQAPAWMRPLMYINPMTYGVDLMRWLLIGEASINLSVDIAMVVGIAMGMTAIGGYLFDRISTT